MKMNSEYIKKIRDHKFYLENFTKIKTKEKGLQPFILKEAQKHFFNYLRKYRYIMLLKARQLGFSSGTTGFFYVDTITRPGITTVLVGYNSDMVTELLDKVKTLYHTTPAAMRPTVHYDSKFQMSFPQMQSKILVLPNTRDVGRGYTINNCLITELSSPEWGADAEEKFTGLKEAITPNGRLVIESTPRGVGNLYHRLWMTDNEFLKLKYGWWWEYTKEQMVEKRKNLGELMWAQEYGLRFLASGRNVFDIDAIEKARRFVLNVGEINKPVTSSQKQCFVKKEGDLIIYRDPEPEGVYCVGIDVSEGVGGDYSVATFWDRKTGEEVAMFRGQIPPDRFGVKLNEWGRRYNKAMLVVEVNNHGLTTLTALRNLIYPSLYMRPVKMEALSAGFSDRLGWRTTKITRPILLDDLGKHLREESIIIHSKKLLDEMSVFVYDDDGNMMSSGGFTDDCIFAAGIGLQAFKQLFGGKLEQLDERKHLPKSFAY